ncbi:autotransporter strand-loop-strand O-heptosyltransferase [Paraburkholderia phytofirmans OLGA172]|uniref:Autotransporter strand-loop-strand O-heptosyltransferase n=1 Tax=Paraburkholderia phytofirmans OLGA172 TaxID=1417228 RepID=A0A160FRI2_9BURK|nr:autotransporter strand-loop-strand O-heptosyltransferase [Paraburkholderia phytofirmans]ANB75615.1 autotransporter strand-loop-strand O-heptosyltransferase [Paraburkholderia phytofirmans OLGA172]
MTNYSESTDVTLLDAPPASAGVAPATSPAPAKGPFPAPAGIPTQKASRGIRFDFNLGCRITLPDGKWRIRLRDLDTGNVLFETAIGAGAVSSAKKYYVRFGIEVWDQSHGDGLRVVDHTYDAKSRPVLIQFPVGTLGDIIGWFPYAVKFQQQHGCRLTCAMSGVLIPLFEEAYPDIQFITPEEVKPEQYYATYNIGLFFDDASSEWQPCDFRQVGLHRTAGHILGVDAAEQAPLLALEDDSRPIPERYVCIAAQSTTQCKYWNHPTGWREIVEFLRARGYRVICIDQKPTHGHGIVWNHIPYGAEDQTGDQPLTERARWLKHADFFIGLSSGLSWLAWAAGTPVVLISGFSSAANEFSTPYRVINYHPCNSCWNDARVRFDHADFLWCPRHAGTPRQFECTRLITPEQVKSVLRRIPGFFESDSEID